MPEDAMSALGTLRKEMYSVCSFDKIDSRPTLEEHELKNFKGLSAPMSFVFADLSCNIWSDIDDKKLNHDIFCICSHESNVTALWSDATDCTAWALNLQCDAVWTTIRATLQGIRNAGGD